MNQVLGLIRLSFLAKRWMLIRVTLFWLVHDIISKDVPQNVHKNGP